MNQRKLQNLRNELEAACQSFDLVVKNIIAEFDTNPADLDSSEPIKGKPIKVRDHMLEFMKRDSKKGYTWGDFRHSLKINQPDGYLKILMRKKEIYYVPPLIGERGGKYYLQNT